MAILKPPMNAKPSPVGFFGPTVWSTIIKAKGEDETERQAAMERLLKRYRQPILNHIYACLSPEQRSWDRAEDLTQEFIHICLRLDFLNRVSPELGLFRTFVKTCIHNFLRDQYVRDSAAKRGGGQAVRSLDETDEEGQPILNPPGSGAGPGEQLDRQWAINVLERSLEALGEQSRAKGHGELFEALKGHLGRAPKPETAAEIGARLNMRAEAVHTAMNRLRGELGKFIRAEVRDTVGTEEDWREELKYLIELLGK
jgi:RNA polymerase sigma factor (sigma-70 family)